MKNLAFFIVLLASTLASCNAGASGKEAKEKPSEATEKPANVTVISLNSESFKKYVFDYQSGKEWKYKGTLPCIIDFYADWCGPCRTLSPRVEEMAKTYNGKIVVYKVNVDNEPLLSQYMGIKNLPTLLFCPMNGQPQISVGLIDNATFKQYIESVLLTK
jgi:thioredoxin